MDYSAWFAQIAGTAGALDAISILHYAMNPKTPPLRHLLLYERQGLYNDINM